MRIVRSWPINPPAHRSGIYDRTSKFYIEKYDLAESEVIWHMGSILLLEWDIYVAPQMLARMRHLIATAPDKVHIAPYKLYPVSTQLQRPVWAHRNIDGEWNLHREQICNLFGFGCVYIPQWVIEEFHLVYDPLSMPFKDDPFSRWHYDNILHDVPVHWEVEVVHCHR